MVRLLTNPRMPVQLLLAGKAHPQDLPGQELSKQWKDFIKRPEVRGSVVFLNDYDMMLAQELVQGIDLWINTPRRPWEACGTSGMKVLVNGGLNLSELDGWWAEAYSPEFGWAIGDGQEHGDDPAWDAREAHALYDLLESEVIPEFYERNNSGMPDKWLGRIHESMAQLTPEFSAARAIREYTESHYLPAASRYHDRAANAPWEQRRRSAAAPHMYLAIAETCIAGKHDRHVHVRTSRFCDLLPNARRCFETAWAQKWAQLPVFEGFSTLWTALSC